MAKDKDRKIQDRAPEAARIAEEQGPPPIMIAGQPVGKYVFSIGLFLLFLGYVLLAKEFLTAAPILIIGGLVVIFLGLWNL
jgi:hypothetical protein